MAIRSDRDARDGFCIEMGVFERNNGVSFHSIDRSSSERCLADGIVPPRSVASFAMATASTESDNHPVGKVAMPPSTPLAGQYANSPLLLTY